MNKFLDVKITIIIIILLLIFGALSDYFLTGFGANWNVKNLLEIEQNEAVKECVSNHNLRYSDFWSITLCLKLKLKLLPYLIVYISLHSLLLWGILSILKDPDFTQKVLFFAIFGGIILSLEQTIAGLTWHWALAKNHLYGLITTLRSPIFSIIILLITIQAIFKKKKSHLHKSDVRSTPAYQPFGNGIT
jgi:hypothetical protein